jgi:hypothetical protein
LGYARGRKEIIMCMTIKYPVNNNYFDEWSSNMAYILGFIITDGCLSKSRNNIRLTFDIKDKSILEFIRDEISPTRPIFKHIKRRLNIPHEVYTLRIHLNSHILEKLLELGMLFRKTGKETCPNNIPIEYFGDYLRGVVDGNGNIGIRQNHNILSARFKITSASKLFLEQLNTYLDNKLYVYHRTKENVYDLCTNNKFIIKELYTILYKNPNFCLDRKYQLFTKAINL